MAAPELERRQNRDHDAYFNNLFEARPVYVEPGGYHIGDDPGEMIVAVMGSGLAVTLYDPGRHIGAVSYLLPPEPMIQSFPAYFNDTQSETRQFFYPLKASIDGLARAGADKTALQVRLIGAMSGLLKDEERGLKSLVIVKERLVREGLSVMHEDCGGHYIRRVHFFPTSGRVVRCLLRRAEDFENMRQTEEEWLKNQ